MTLQVYPSIPKPFYSYIVDHQFRTSLTDFDSGTEQRNMRWRFPKRTFINVYKLMAFSAIQRDAIYEFFQNRSGSYDLFWYFDFQDRKWVDQYVGRGDGVTQTYDVPGILTTTVTLDTIDNILTEAGDNILTEDGDYIIGEGNMVQVGASPPIIYVDEIATTSFNYSAGTGQAGVDQIIFGTTPPIGSLITCDLPSAYLRIKGRFKDDKLTEEIITTHLGNLSVSIYEMKQ